MTSGLTCPDWLWHAVPHILSAWGGVQFTRATKCSFSAGGTMGLKAMNMEMHSSNQGETSFPSLVTNTETDLLMG